MYATSGIRCIAIRVLPFLMLKGYLQQSIDSVWYSNLLVNARKFLNSLLSTNNTYRYWNYENVSQQPLLAQMSKIIQHKQHSRRWHNSDISYNSDDNKDNTEIYKIYFKIKSKWYIIFFCLLLLQWICMAHIKTKNCLSPKYDRDHHIKYVCCWKQLKYEAFAFLQDIHKIIPYKNTTNHFHFQYIIIT